MDIDVDHYSVLGLPTGEEGAKLTEKEISKAYKAKALVLHPDKRPDDPNAHANFQRVKTSYEILKDDKARKLFDDLLSVKREQHRRHFERDSKKRKMVSDLEKREKAAFDPDPAARARAKEEEIARKFEAEITRIRAMHANKGAPPTSVPKAESVGTAGATLNKERVLKVSWENVGEGYTSERLRELFSKFGGVEDVVIKSTKKKGSASALVVMASKDAAVAATGAVSGDLSNPLLVVPLQPVVAAEIPTVQKPVEVDQVNKLVGYQAFEDAVLEKFKKKQKIKNEI
ncbi:hypothetical protein UlMin_030992 [Ulmus minor]